MSALEIAMATHPLHPVHRPWLWTHADPVFTLGRLKETGVHHGFDFHSSPVFVVFIPAKGQALWGKLPEAFGLN
jgi:hypothetical protein